MTPHHTRRAVDPIRAAATLVAVSLLIALASAMPADVAAPRRVLVLPVEGARIESLARLPAANWQPGHRGIDVTARVGDEVVAPGAGTVTFVGWVVNRPVVTIDHGGGLVSSLEPVDATAEVGAVVARGEPIGTTADAAGHCAPRTCVHWGVRLDGAYVDPLDYLAGYGPVVLLTLSEASQPALATRRLPT